MQYVYNAYNEFDYNELLATTSRYFCTKIIHNNCANAKKNWIYYLLGGHCSSKVEYLRALNVLVISLDQIRSL